MHIPDGYLSPQTYVPLWGASVAMWAVGLKKIKKELSVKQVPYLSMAAAFSFLIMMFNVPIPGGTSGHAVGAAIIAILLGPWTAMVAVSVVLIIQALVFGDGGVTAIGANCFNMAIIMPFVSYWVFVLVSGSGKSAARVYSAAFLSGYIGLSVAAVSTAVMFGIQPIIAVGPDGHPLYAPYPLSIAVPIMAAEHLLAFSVLEGVITLFLVKYFYKAADGFSLKALEAPASLSRKIWAALIILAVLSPIGIILPEVIKSGDAWGEWGTDALQKMLGYVPAGLSKLAGLWNAPLSGYGTGEGTLLVQSGWYIFSALLVVGLMWLVTVLLRRALYREVSGGTESVRLARPPRVGRHEFLDKGIHHLAKIIRIAYIQWETSRRPGFFQGLDARVKVLFAVSLLIVISLKQEVGAMTGILLFCFVLAAASRVEMLVYARRVLFFAFLFGFLLSFPSAFNLFVDGKVIWPMVTLSGAHDFWIYHIPQTIGITREGLYGTARLTLRVADSIAVSLLVLYTTPFHEVIRALKMLRVPDPFLMVLTLAYKYIFIFAQTVENMHLAKKSRLAGGVGGAEARRWIAGRMGMIFKKTQMRCEEIFKALLSRGYSGEVKLAGSRRMRRSDYAYGAGLLCAAVLFLFI
jgi:cobalt ECF transporter T component CbiQ/cobalamin biosynthesis protein CbiM